MKDKYPAGSSTDPQFAWKKHKFSAAFDCLPTLTARLNHLFLVEENLWNHKINLPFSIPINIDFVQYIKDYLLHNQLPKHLDNNYFSDKETSSSSSNADL